MTFALLVRGIITATAFSSKPNSIVLLYQIYNDTIHFAGFRDVWTHCLNWSLLNCVHLTTTAYTFLAFCCQLIAYCMYWDTVQQNEYKVKNCITIRIWYCGCFLLWKTWRYSQQDGSLPLHLPQANFVWPWWMYSVVYSLPYHPVCTHEAPYSGGYSLP